jgi:hypothetical protein
VNTLINLIKFIASAQIMLRTVFWVGLLLLPGGILVALWLMGQPFKKRRWKKRTPSRGEHNTSL